MSDPEELIEIFSKFFNGTGADSVLRKVRDVIKAYDTNGNGKLEFAEFVDMVCLLVREIL